jgi:hypothetical protein
VATAPTPAFAQGTTCPTAKKRDATATPISPAAGSQAAIEKVAILDFFGLSHPFARSGAGSKLIKIVKPMNMKIVTFTIFVVNGSPYCRLCMFKTSFYILFHCSTKKHEIIFTFFFFKWKGKRKK